MSDITSSVPSIGQLVDAIVAYSANWMQIAQNNGYVNTREPVTPDMFTVGHNNPIDSYRIDGSTNSDRESLREGVIYVIEFNGNRFATVYANASSIGFDMVYVTDRAFGTAKDEKELELNTHSILYSSLMDPTFADDWSAGIKGLVFTSLNEAYEIKNVGVRRTSNLAGYSNVSFGRMVWMFIDKFNTECRKYGMPDKFTCGETESKLDSMDSAVIKYGKYQFMRISVDEENNITSVYSDGINANDDSEIRENPDQDRDFVGISSKAFQVFAHGTTVSVPERINHCFIVPAINFALICAARKRAEEKVDSIANDIESDAVTFRGMMNEKLIVTLSVKNQYDGRIIVFRINPTDNGIVFIVVSKFGNAFGRAYRSAQRNYLSCLDEIYSNNEMVAILSDISKIIPKSNIKSDYQMSEDVLHSEAGYDKTVSLPGDKKEGRNPIQVKDIQTRRLHQCEYLFEMFTRAIRQTYGDALTTTPDGKFATTPKFENKNWVISLFFRGKQIAQILVPLVNVMDSAETIPGYLYFKSGVGTEIYPFTGEDFLPSSIREKFKKAIPSLYSVSDTSADLVDGSPNMVSIGQALNALDAATSSLDTLLDDPDTPKYNTLFDSLDGMDGYEMYPNGNVKVIIDAGNDSYRVIETSEHSIKLEDYTDGVNQTYSFSFISPNYEDYSPRDNDVYDHPELCEEYRNADDKTQTKIYRIIGMLAKFVKTGSID